MTPDPASPVDAVTEAWPRDLDPVLDAVREERRHHEVELACAENGHAWFGYVTGDQAHGVVGKCPCGSHLYAIDGTELDS